MTSLDDPIPFDDPLWQLSDVEEAEYFVLGMLYYEPKTVFKCLMSLGLIPSYFSSSATRRVAVVLYILAKEGLVSRENLFFELGPEVKGEAAERILVRLELANPAGLSRPQYFQLLWRGFLHLDLKRENDRLSNLDSKKEGH